MYLEALDSLNIVSWPDKTSPQEFIYMSLIVLDKCQAKNGKAYSVECFYICNKYFIKVTHNIFVYLFLLLSK